MDEILGYNQIHLNNLVQREKRSSGQKVAAKSLEPALH